MVSKKQITSISELQDIQRLAVESSSDVDLCSEDKSMIIDAKSYIGMYALDFSKPILIESDDPEFHEKIKNIGKNL